MVWLGIGVGNDHIHQQWVPVVPNRDLDAELLLGTDVLGKSSFHWNEKSNTIVWGNASYVVGHKATKRESRKNSTHPPNINPR